MRIVLAFGTFDLLHPGHVAYLRQAKKFGDRLIVVIARDKNVTKTKRHSTLFSENDRKKLVEALRDVDSAVLGSLGDALNIIKKIKPNTICLGYDHDIDESSLALELSSMKTVPKIVRAKSYHAEKYKSSMLKKC